MKRARNPIAYMHSKKRGGRGTIETVGKFERGPAQGRRGHGGMRRRKRR